LFTGKNQLLTGFVSLAIDVLLVLSPSMTEYMKRVLTALAAIVFISGLSGCLSTLFPLFTQNDIVFDRRLIGKWDTGKDNKRAVFEQGSPNAFAELPEGLKKISDRGYILTITNLTGNEINKYYAFLVKIGSNHYFDYYPAETGKEKRYDAFFKMHHTKLHSFFRVKFNNDSSFEISQFDEGYLRNLIDQKQIRIRHEKRFDGSYLITAPTSELQQYVMKYSDVPEAYFKESIATYKKIE
jgi:hypothetical protein